MNPALPNQTKHIISHYDAALYQLRNDVVTMFNLTSTLLETAFLALSTRNCDLCDQAAVQDQALKLLEKQVNQEGLSLLVRFHPVATDLRQVISAMKVSTNLERIADQSVIIAQRARRLNSRSFAIDVELVVSPYRHAHSIFFDSMRAFVGSDCAVASSLKLRDQELEALTTTIGEKLVHRATLEPDNVPSYLDLIFVSRALKRIGDHATHIGEDSFWRDQAVDISQA
jgi:phosphate transport system protein